MDARLDGRTGNSMLTSPSGSALTSKDAWHDSSMSMATVTSASGAEIAFTSMDVWLDSSISTLMTTNCWRSGPSATITGASTMLFGVSVVSGDLGVGSERSMPPKSEFKDAWPDSSTFTLTVISRRSRSMRANKPRTADWNLVAKACTRAVASSLASSLVAGGGASLYLSSSRAKAASASAAAAIASACI